MSVLGTPCQAGASQGRWESMRRHCRHILLILTAPGCSRNLCTHTRAKVNTQMMKVISSYWMQTKYLVSRRILIFTQHPLFSPILSSHSLRPQLWNEAPSISMTSNWSAFVKPSAKVDFYYNSWFIPHGSRVIGFVSFGFTCPTDRRGAEVILSNCV